MVIEGDVTATGFFGVVRVNGLLLTTRRANEVSAVPCSGFGWGYEGTGSHHLALALLLAAGLDEGEAREWAVAFKDDFLLALAPHAPFRIEVDVLEWVAQRWAATEPKDSF